MAKHLTDTEIDACERLLGAALQGVATELRLVDVGDLISYVRGDRLANIRDLIASCTELYFRPGTLQFGDVADAETQWGRPARILIDMEFQDCGITAFLRLTLSPASASVEMLGLLGAAEMAGASHLAHALKHATLPAQS